MRLTIRFFLRRWLEKLVCTGLACLKYGFDFGTHLKSRWANARPQPRYYFRS
jgi:hypothetical protein